MNKHMNLNVLHEIERRIILTLKDNIMSIEEISNHSKLTLDQVRRGIEWLKYKGLIEIDENIIKVIQLDTNGIKALKYGLPERRLVNSIDNAKAIREIKDSIDEFNVAIAYAKSNNWISIEKGIIKVINREKSDEELLLEKLENPKRYDELNNNEIKAYESLKHRPNYVKEVTTKQSYIRLSKAALELLPEITKLQTRTLDLEAIAPIIYTGNKHPLQDVIDEIREVLIGLGFQEINGNYIQSTFWNFDILFTPQDHSAREMQDTFYLKELSNEHINEAIINNVRRAHEEGWHYKWDYNESKRLVLRTHTTAVTIRYLADNKPEEASVFTVGRVFRNEKLTYKHLIEFHQVEGIMIKQGLTLRDLMGLQREFYYRLGLKKVKFWPTYFPYTEPSLQSMVYHERLGKWVELFGMGIFRPEVTKPIGIKYPVLAWGGGVERIAMLKYDLDDLRELYTNRLSWLRGVPKYQ